jgi:hypothetical protein
MISSKLVGTLLVGGAFCIASSPARAQVQTSKSESQGEPTHEVKVERGEIVYVSGNNVIVKMDDGTIRHFNNVPDSATINVDGKQLNVHQLQAGMKVEKQTITTSTPRVVTTVKTVKGKVFHVTPPLSVILTLEDGTNQEFKIPKGQKFNVDGQMTDAFGLKKGMVISAQKVTEVPETVITQQIKRTGTAPPPPEPIQQDVPVLVVYVPSTPAAQAAPVETAAAEPAPKKLPTTASNLPLVGLSGLVLLAGSLMALLLGRKVRPS